MRRSELSQRKLSAARYFDRRHFLFGWPDLITKTGVARAIEASFMSGATSQIICFYNRHPISCEIITKLRESRGRLDGLRPEELFPYDQDHYGGLAATDELARGAQISNGSHVADFCAGLGGTVRYLAHKYGADVTGIELNASARHGCTGVDQTRWPSRYCADCRG